MPIKLLVIDVDNTALMLGKMNPQEPFGEAPSHLLSPRVIEFAKTHGYVGFYICTHRCFVTVEEAVMGYVKPIEYSQNSLAVSNLPRDQLKVKFAKMTNYKKTDVEDVFLSRVVKNFSRSTGLTCLGVSTPDDVKHSLGAGYKQIIKPFEEEVIKQKRLTITEDPFLVSENPQNILPKFCTKFFPLVNPFSSYYSHVIYFDSDTKNNQLIDIAGHARKKFGGEELIYLDYIDDVKVISKNALLIPSKNIPSNVEVRVFNHNAFDQTSIKPCILQQDTGHVIKTVRGDNSKTTFSLPSLPKKKPQLKRSQSMPNFTTMLTLFQNDMTPLKPLGMLKEDKLSLASAKGLFSHPADPPPKYEEATENLILYI